jgi:hypothetical protein
MSSDIPMKCPTDRMGLMTGLINGAAYPGSDITMETATSCSAGLQRTPM